MRVKRLADVTIQKVIILSLTIFISVFSFGQQKKLANSLLWEISHPNHKKTSYLFGTMHVSNKVAFHLQDSLLTAINNVDLVGLELNPETWLYDMSHSEVFDAIVKSAHSNININRFYELVSTYTVIDKSVLRTALVDNNNFINNLLYRFSGAANRNYEETTYLDLYIYQLGKKLKKDVIGLENFNKTMEMAIKAMQPDDDPKQEEKSKNNYEKQLNNFKIMVDIESAYRNWNLNDIDSLMKLTYISKNHEKYLIDDRNLIMLNGLDSIMQNGSIFCGVGAAHLPGEKGLIKLLRSKGYTVKPVLDKETFSGRKKRDKVEQKLYSHVVNDYTLPDASIKYSLPGELINVPTHNENQFLLYPDMVNGSYYAIYRLSHYQRLLGRTEDYASLMVDSLLYENIPGKILSKKQITSNNNLPGIELASRLPSGDYMQFNIFYSPLEIIIIKAGGNHKTFQSTEWNRFFNSITFNEDKIHQEWIRHNNTKGGFAVDIPKGFLECNFTNQNLINSRLQGYNKASDAYYYLTANTINDYEYIEDDKFELAHITQLWSKTLNSEIIEESTYEENNSIIHDVKIQYKDNDKNAWLKVILKGYNVFVMLTNDENKNTKKRFFSSFTSINSQDFKLCTLTDSVLLFTTKTDDLKWKKKNEIQHLLQKNTSPVYNNYNKKIDDKVYYSSTTSAAVEVQRDELSKYTEIKSVDSYLLNRNTFYISRKQGNYLDTTSKYCTPVVNTDSIFSRDLIIKDSSSARAILMKNILSKNSAYTLSTVIDTMNGLTTWQQHFFDNFTPIDTGDFSNPLIAKKQRILADMQSTDSATNEYLSENFPRYYFIDHPDDAPHLYRFLQEGVFASFDLSTRSNIIESSGEIEPISDKYLEQLEAMYHSAGDTTEIQIAILTALSEMKTASSFQLISKLMEENLPLAEDDYMLYTLFFNLSDTLELSKLLFPSILNQLSITEYTGLILELMTEMAVENQLEYSLWKEHKNNIIRGAQLELKRYRAAKANAEEEDDDNDYSYSNKNEYGNTVPWDYGYEFSDLARYTAIMATVYNNDNKAKNIIDYAWNSKDKSLIFTSALSLNKNNQLQNDTVWNWLAADEKFRMHLLDWLEITKDTALYPSEYYSPDLMANSWLQAIPYNKEEKDSISLIKKVKLADAYGEGYVYFYKYKDGDEWKLNYVGFQPGDTTKMVSDFRHYEKKGILLDDMKETTIAKAIDNVIKEVQLKGRRRAGNSYGGAFDDYFYD